MSYPATHIQPWFSVAAVGSSAVRPSPLASGPAVSAAGAAALSGVACACGGSLSGNGMLSGSGLLEPWEVLKDWWNHYVSSSYSWLNASVDAIRRGCNDLLSEGDATGEWYAERIGECHDTFIQYIGAGCFHADEIEKILACYHNLVRQGSIREFSRSLPDADRGAIYRSVGICSGSSYHQVMLVMMVMHSLYNATPSTVHVGVIYPLAWQRQQENRAEPQDWDTVGSWLTRAADSVGGAIATAVDVLHWTLLIAGLGLIGYVAYNAYVGTKTLS